MRLAAATLILITGCVEIPEAPRPANLAPVDIQTAVTSLTAAYPKAKAFSVLDYDGRGVEFATDGTAAFVRPAVNPRVETTISGFEDNTICIAETGNFPGLCIDLYKTEGGTYYCDRTFGNGGFEHHDCTIMPIRETG